MSKNKRTNKRKKSAKTTKLAAAEFCRCCVLVDRVERVLADGSVPLPIPAPKLLYLALEKEPTLCVSFLDFHEAIGTLEDDGVIVSEGGIIRLVERVRPTSVNAGQSETLPS